VIDLKLKNDRDTSESSQLSDPRWFRAALFGVVTLGAIVRVAFALSVKSRGLTADASFFHVAAENIASGKGYVTYSGVPTAIHPPVFPSMLAVFDLVDLRSVEAQRIGVAVVASAGVLLTGLLARKVAGARVGIVAAVIAAGDPLWFQPSGILMSESIYLIVIPAILLTALLCAERPTAWRFGNLGVLIAIATLIRSEAIDFIVLLGVPVIVIGTGDWRRRLETGLAMAVGFVLILTPWLIRNEIQLGGASLSTNGGVTLAGSYCSATFNPRDPTYGSFNVACAVYGFASAAHHTKSNTELTINRALTSRAETFTRGHLSDMPRVVLARELSVWGFGNQSYQLSLAVAEGRVRGYEQAGMILYWVSLPFVIVGAVVLARLSWRRFVIVTVPLVVVALNSAIFYGSTRMRMAAEPSLAVLASFGIVATLTWIGRLNQWTIWRR
jgi:hypothetical protein